MQKQGKKFRGFAGGQLDGGDASGSAQNCMSYSLLTGIFKSGSNYVIMKAPLQLQVFESYGSSFIPDATEKGCTPMGGVH